MGRGRLLHRALRTQMVARRISAHVSPDRAPDKLPPFLLQPNSDLLSAPVSFQFNTATAPCCCTAALSLHLHASAAITVTTAQHSLTAPPNCAFCLLRPVSCRLASLDRRRSTRPPASPIVPRPASSFLAPRRAPTTTSPQCPLTHSHTQHTMASKVRPPARQYRDSC